MAQAPRPGIPTAPPPPADQGGHPQGAQGQTGPNPAQVNIHGQPPQPHMAPAVEAPAGLGDNTNAEMEAGKANLKQYRNRDDAEHDAGRHAVEQRAARPPQK